MSDSVEEQFAMFDIKKPYMDYDLWKAQEKAKEETESEKQHSVDLAKKMYKEMGVDIPDNVEFVIKDEDDESSEVIE